MNARHSTPLKFVGLGEVLFDVFEDGTATLGGAPLNVAVHTHQLAAALAVGEGVVVSRVGDDVGGKRICDSLAQRRMSTRYLQTDPVHPTGAVSVFMRDGEPGYQFEANAAWDFFERDASFDYLSSVCDAVCFGSLAQRSAQSAKTIRAFLASAKQAVRLYDVNLRRNTLTHEPGYSAEIIEGSCELATLVKVNCTELFQIATLFDIDADIAGDNVAIRELVHAVMHRLSVRALILTRGAKGTTLYANGGEFSGNLPVIPIEDVHPVGTGDACTAGILFGSVLGFSPDAAVDLGNRMGAWVASHRTATPVLSPDIVTFVAQLAAMNSTYEGGLLVETA